jgi:hypothetical protein
MRSRIAHPLVDAARQHRGQIHEEQQLPEQRQYIREPAHQIGESHDPEVIVADMTQLVGQHPGDLARRQCA